MLRRGSNAILALSAALLLAAAAGVQLGESAIAEINPIHFQGVAAPPRGIDPNAVRPAPDAFASAYGWDAGHAARAAECGGDCDARLALDATVFAFDEPARAHRASGPYWRDATPTTEPAAWAPGEAGNGGLGVERYMHYPVAEETAEPAEARIPPHDEDSGED